jgi:serine/threonine protein kinase
MVLRMSEIGFVQADKLVPLAGRLTLGDFSILKVIGKGGMGKVMLVRHRASGRMYALKSIHKQWILAHGQLQHAKSERAIMAAFRESFNVAECTEENLDKFLIKLHASFQTTTELFYVLDFHPGGDLASILAHHVRLGEGRAKFYAVEIAVGLGLLHSKGIVYRDLKPENVLLDARGHVVLTDFGLSKMLQNESESEPQTVAATLCGTAEYLAPEILRREPYDQSVDWWSFGVMLYEMIVGTTPFWNPSPQRMYLNILTLPRIEFPVWVSPEARDLIAAVRLEGCETDSLPGFCLAPQSQQSMQAKLRPSAWAFLFQRVELGGCRGPQISAPICDGCC